MPRLTRDALLQMSDLREAEVDLDGKGNVVLVRGLSAAYANEAQSEALEVVTTDGVEQRTRVNTAKLEALQVLRGLVDPHLNHIAEAETFLKNCGPAARKLVDKIDELSAIDKEAIAAATAQFPDGGGSETGSGGDGVTSDDGGSPVPARTGA